MDKLFEGIKKNKFIFFTAAVCAILVLAVFLISVLAGKKEKPIVPEATKEKNDFGSLSAPILDSSGNPIMENRLENLPQPSPEISPINRLENLSQPSPEISPVNHL